MNHGLLSSFAACQSEAPFQARVQTARIEITAICDGSGRLCSIQFAIAAILCCPTATRTGSNVPVVKAQPFTAPAVRPCTMYRLANANNTIVGMIVSTAAADIDPQSML